MADKKVIYHARSREEFDRLEELTQKFFESYWLEGDSTVLVHPGEDCAVRMVPKNSYFSLQPASENPQGILVGSDDKCVVFEIDGARYCVEHRK
jgi:hypothetical protein